MGFFSATRTIAATSLDVRLPYEEKTTRTGWDYATHLVIAAALLFFAFAGGFSAQRIPLLVLALFYPLSLLVVPGTVRIAVRDGALSRDIGRKSATWPVGMIDDMTVCTMYRSRHFHKLSVPPEYQPRVDAMRQAGHLQRWQWPPGYDAVIVFFRDSTAAIFPTKNPPLLMLTLRQAMKS